MRIRILESPEKRWQYSLMQEVCQQDFCWIFLCNVLGFCLLQYSLMVINTTKKNLHKTIWKHSFHPISVRLCSDEKYTKWPESRDKTFLLQTALRWCCVLNSECFLTKQTVCMQKKIWQDKISCLVRKLSCARFCLHGRRMKSLITQL